MTEQMDNIKELVEIAQEIGAKVQIIEAEKIRCFMMRSNELPIAFDIDGSLVLVMSFGEEQSAD